MSTGRITLRVDEVLQEKLGTLAQAAGKSESQIVREALEDYLSRHTVVTCYDVAKKAGIIGCVKGGPKDMSTNRKYMEGFGRD
ncbi:MAG: CopG family transcriptional regulator [Planctomycetia bacterium]|nr:CopG family transcriptional regulator [Planctomycetia bacterium]